MLLAIPKAMDIALMPATSPAAALLQSGAAPARGAAAAEGGPPPGFAIAATWLAGEPLVLPGTQAPAKKAASGGDDLPAGGNFLPPGWSFPFIPVAAPTPAAVPAAAAQPAPAAPPCTLPSAPADPDGMLLLATAEAAGMLLQGTAGADGMPPSVAAAPAPAIPASTIAIAGMPAPAEGMPPPANGTPAALPRESGRGPQVPIEFLGRALPQQVMDLLAAGRAPRAAPAAGEPAANGATAAAPVLEVRQPPKAPAKPGPAPLPPVVTDTGAEPVPSLPPHAAAVAEAAIALEASYGPAADRAASVVAAAKAQRPDDVPDGPAATQPAAARSPELSQNLLAEAVRASVPADGSGLRHDPAAPRDSLPPVTLPTLAATPPAPPAAQPAAQLQLNTPVGSDGWAQSLGDRVVTLTERDVSHAQLKLNPPQLGPLEVRVQVNGDQASVSFTTHSSVTRDALEQAAPRLREMLGSQGFASVNVSVSQHSFSERPQQPMRYEPLPSWAEAIATPAASQAAAASRVARSLLDAYA